MNRWYRSVTYMNRWYRDVAHVNRLYRRVTYMNRGAAALRTWSAWISGVVHVERLDWRCCAREAPGISGVAHEKHLGLAVLRT
jgi:hypothetical protein